MGTTATLWLRSGFPSLRNGSWWIQTLTPSCGRMEFLYQYRKYGRRVPIWVPLLSGVPEPAFNKVIRPSKLHQRFLLAGTVFQHRSIWPRADFLSHPELTPAAHGSTAYCETEFIWEKADLQAASGCSPTLVRLNTSTRRRCKGR